MSASTSGLAKSVSPAMKRHVTPCPSPEVVRSVIHEVGKSRLAGMFGGNIEFEPPSKVSRGMPIEEDILDDDEPNKKSDLRSVNVADGLIGIRPELVQYKEEFIENTKRHMKDRLSDVKLTNDEVNALKTVMRAAITGVVKDTQADIRAAKKTNELVDKLQREHPNVPGEYLKALLLMEPVPDQPSTADVAQNTPHIVSVCQRMRVDLSTVDWLFSQYYAHHGAESLDNDIAVANDLSKTLKSCERPNDADAYAYDAYARAWFIRHYVQLNLVDVQNVRACYQVYLNSI